MPSSREDVDISVATLWLTPKFGLLPGDCDRCIRNLRAIRRTPGVLITVSSYTLPTDPSSRCLSTRDIEKQVYSKQKSAVCHSEVVQACSTSSGEYGAYPSAPGYHVYRPHPYGVSVQHNAHAMPLALPNHHRTKSSSSPEPPHQKNEYNQPQPSKRPILLQQQLPINPHRRTLILSTILPQPTTHVPHLLQTVPPIQQILDILRHYLRHILQFVVQPAQIVRGPAILICLFRAFNEAFELAVLVGSKGGREVVGAFVAGLKFGADILQEGEGEFFGVGFFRYGYVAEGVVEDVAVRMVGVYVSLLAPAMRAGSYCCAWSTGGGGRD